MFAGAAREAVFSNPDVVERIHASFIPVALKAALVNNPGNDEEGRLYREIGRSRPAPQGICVANSAGKVLDWALMFDDEASVLAFLDHSLERFREYPDAQRSVAAERYMKFPSTKLEDVPDTGRALPTAAAHPTGKRCPAKPGVPPGTVMARVLGRALGRDGKPLAETAGQENYVEDRFDVSVSVQQALARALAGAGTDRVRLPDQLARLCVTHAYLGQLDVQPLENPSGGAVDLDKAEFWAAQVAQPLETGTAPAAHGPRSDRALWRIQGKSEVASALVRGGGAGRGYEHEVRLDWDGYIEMAGQRISSLLLAASGTEKLKWGSSEVPTDTAHAVAYLPAGRPIDWTGRVRYGIIGEVACGDDLSPAQSAPASDAARERTPAVPPGLTRQPTEQPPDIARQLIGTLGPQFAIFLTAVEDDLELSAEQKKTLTETRAGAWTGLAQFMQQVGGLSQADREAKLQEFREGANKNLAALLAGTLSEEQHKRLRQIVLQQQGLFALADPQVAGELQFGGEQTKRFLMRILQETQKRFESFQERAHEAVEQKAQATGNPEEVQEEAAKWQRDAAKIRREQEAKIEALLTDAQKEQWKRMLGKPLALEEAAHPKE